MSDLVFYDTETNDADARHGQILQFAGIRTDGELNVIGKMELRVRPLPWIVPMPAALRVTGMDVRELYDPEALSEFVAAGEIARFMKTPYGAERTFVTFNGIQFDDKLIQTTLFRNLQAFPWFNSGKNFTRVDMLDGVRLLHHLDPDAIVPSFREDGSISWRLETVCPANGIAIRAHDALGDADALRHLVRLIRERAPKVWETLVRCGKTSNVEDAIDRAMGAGEPMFLFTHFGRPEIGPCFPLAADGMRKYVMADLRAGEFPTDFDSASKVINKAGTPYPTVRSNLSPILLDAETAMSVMELDLAGLTEIIRKIKADPRIGEVARQIVTTNNFASDEEQTSEQKINAGFPSEAVKERMRQFLASPSWRQRAEMHFPDPRMSDFAARIVLDAVHNGQAVLEESICQQLEERADAALARPYAPRESRWATIEEALCQEPDDEWVRWANRHFNLGGDWGDTDDAEPAATADVDIDRGPSQFSFGF